MKSNSMMREVWDGEVGRFWADEAERYERMNSGFGARLLEMAAPLPGERFLDVGCGHGARTFDLAAAVGPSGEVVGVDISGPMLEVARRRAVDRQVPHVEFRKADAQTDELGRAWFDGVVSQFGVMFFADPEAAFANLRRALVDGGRLVFSCWQALAEQQRIMVPVLAALQHVPVPEFDEANWSQAAFSLADRDHIGSLLVAAGFTEVSVEAAVLPEYQGRDVSDVVEFMRRTELAEVLFARADPDQAAQGWDAIGSALQPHVTADGVHLNGAAWLVHARAAQPRSGALVT